MYTGYSHSTLVFETFRSRALLKVIERTIAMLLLGGGSFLSGRMPQPIPAILEFLACPRSSRVISESRPPMMHESYKLSPLRTGWGIYSTALPPVSHAAWTRVLSAYHEMVNA